MFYNIKKKTVSNGFLCEQWETLHTFISFHYKPPDFVSVICIFSSGLLLLISFLNSSINKYLLRFYSTHHARKELGSNTMINLIDMFLSLKIFNICIQLYKYVDYN